MNENKFVVSPQIQLPSEIIEIVIDHYNFIDNKKYGLLICSTLIAFFITTFRSLN